MLVRVTSERSPGATFEIFRSEIHGGLAPGYKDGESGELYPGRRGENGRLGENGCVDLRIEPCLSGNGGRGGGGGFGGNGRGGDSIGIAYLDEGSVTLGEGVVFEIGQPGRGGVSDPLDAPWAPAEGPPGEAHEMFRYPPYEQP